MSEPGTGSLHAVTFDFWNTLCFELRGQLRSRRLEAWAGLLEEAGFACERDRLDAVFSAAWAAHQRSWHAGQQYQAAHAAEHMLEELGFEVPEAVRHELVASFTSVGGDVELRLTEGAAGCLRRLKGAGIRLGIICDVGFTPSPVLRGHLQRHGVLDLFDHWSFSDEVGHYKPSPEIFRHALAGLGADDPARVAHVGDLRRTDVAGALGMGMVAVRYRGVEDDTSQPEPEAHHVIDHHDQLPAVLGLA